jgi:hypothetical protein
MGEPNLPADRSSKREGGKGELLVSGVALRFRGATRRLRSGEYLIGRANECEISLRGPRVSRRHARLHVERGGASIEDLGSANGVLVNGRRIPAAGLHGLSQGDRIEVGGIELTMLEADATQSSTKSFEPPDFDAAPGPTLNETGFEMAGKIAARALAERRTEVAIEVLHGPLARVLDDARSARYVPEQVRDAALRHACQLACATADNRWTNYAFDLLSALPSPFSVEIDAAVEAALRQVRRPDPERILGYVRKLAREPLSWERIRATQRADRLLRIIGRAA